MKNQIIIIVSVILLIAGWFYWFELRPSNIKRECYKFVKDNFERINTTESINLSYSMCLHKNGL